MTNLRNSGIYRAQRTIQSMLPVTLFLIGVWNVYEYPSSEVGWVSLLGSESSSAPFSCGRRCDARPPSSKGVPFAARWVVALLAAFALMFLHVGAAVAVGRIVVPERLTLDQREDIGQKLNDWPQLERFAKDNALLPAPKAGEKRVVFMGDSITDFWGRPVGEFFPGRGFINRGISGQTTPQMLVRFRADVIALKPAVVVILAGTNDIAGNTGPSSLAMIEDNLSSMTELARAHGIRVVLASLLPVNDYVTKDQSLHRPAATIRALNDWMRDYAKRENLGFVDYYSAMVDEHGALKKGLSDDGLHPNAAGYALMAPLALKGIEAALVGGN